MAATTIPTITYYEDKTIIEKCGHGGKMVTGSLAFTTYSATTTSGVTFDLRNQLPAKVHIVQFDNCAGYILTYDYTNRRIKVYNTAQDSTSDAVLTEISDATSLATPLAAVRFIAFGK